MAGAPVIWRAVALSALVTFFEPGGVPSAADVALVASPETPGPQAPPVGQSLFDELFKRPAEADSPARYDLPFPFERLIEAVNTWIAPSGVRTALIPLGRSLQRFAADPDYFESPRVVVAVDAEGEAFSLDQPLLKDRLFLGYQPRSAVIEVISYNEGAGRFEFQKVENYDGTQAPAVEYTERAVCLTCHQGHAPIFSTPLWSETNANPKVVERLSGLGDGFHGAPVRQGVDGPDAFDLATDRANRFAALQMIWRDGCGSGAEGVRCRRALILAALRFRLGGSRASWQPAESNALKWGGALQARSKELWPDGLWTPDPDIPNRDPIVALKPGVMPFDTIEPFGVFDPTAPREPILVWKAAASEVETFAGVAREVASWFARRDIAWLDARLSAAPSRVGTTYRAACRSRRVDRGAGAHELRIRCGRAEDGLLLDGHLTRRESAVIGGAIRELAIDGGPPIRRLRVAGGNVIADGATEILSVELREGAAGLAARLPTGERLSYLVLTIDRSGEGDAEVSIIDDVADLGRAVTRIAEISAGSGEGPFGSGPLRRRAVLAALDAALGGR